MNLRLENVGAVEREREREKKTPLFTDGKIEYNLSEKAIKNSFINHGFCRIRKSINMEISRSFYIYALFACN